MSFNKQLSKVNFHEVGAKLQITWAYIINNFTIAIKSVKIILKSKITTNKKGRKTSFPKEQEENSDLHKPVFNKMTTQE